MLKPWSLGDLQGSAFVTLRAKALLPCTRFDTPQAKRNPELISFPAAILRGSKYGSSAQINIIADCFDKTAKRTFKGDGRPCIITFGTPFDTDVEHGIRSGRLKIPRQVSLHVQVLR